MQTLAQLEQTEDFVRRHIGPGAVQIEAMLAELGVDSMSRLLDEAVPGAIRLDDELALAPPMTERMLLRRLREIAGANDVYRSMIGMGYYGTVTPPVILRNILENPAWYTAYTPYQPEISQGRLEALLNFQTMVSDLTAMDMANASLLDEGTAAAEAMTMARRLSSAEPNVFFVDVDCHPQTVAVIQTRAEPLGIEVQVGDPFEDLDATGVYAALFQYPGSSGAVHDHEPLVAGLHEHGALAVFSADLLALTLLRPPGAIGADIVVGSSQRFGVPMGYGGPHAAYMACREEYQRSLPGRLVGVSVDAHGRMALRLALQTREQHIRREKATSNICTAQVLLAVIAGMYAVYHGPEGLRTIAARVHLYASLFAEGLEAGGVAVDSRPFFDTVTVTVPTRAVAVQAAARVERINVRVVDRDHVSVAFDETTSRSDLIALWRAFGVAGVPLDDNSTATSPVPEGLQRTTPYLTHPVFHRYRSETEMLRYMRRLADKDIALDRAMIPLGSCTMKLNATSEMLPITWREFAHLHPFAPADQAAGYRVLIAELEQMLAEITGYAAVSLQPNSGAQGEFAGLLAIRSYHKSRGDDHRDVCLIPSSAHGTNPASATMAGMRVVVVETDDHGNVDLEDLRAKASAHADRLAALMITYPSTHGVFESEVREICKTIHDFGGQVYLDGANLNAMVGVAKPGEFGSDVSHLNLHKTFTIPHGGGGPGVGPIGVAAHLAPFLPNHPVVPEAGPVTGPGPVAAAPWGSAGILPISWAYIALMGGSGLTRATEVAILSANYIAKRLADHYPILYTGLNGWVAHECILDLRPMREETGVTVDDVAKRLIDFGFHAPTMSFPVPGTLMVEPTESESRAELDRFCDAMIAIRAEADAIAAGEVEYEHSALHHAPHTAEDVLGGDWDRPYTREQAVYPGSNSRASKYWPPVSRIDNRYGDRNVVCECPPIDTYR